MVSISKPRTQTLVLPHQLPLTHSAHCFHTVYLTPKYCTKSMISSDCQLPGRLTLPAAGTEEEPAVSTPPTNIQKREPSQTHMHTHMHTQMHQIQGNLDRILHICRVLNSKSTTHTKMLTHLHLHEGSPIEAACCSREGTPQTTPLSHGRHTPLLPSLKPHSFFFFFYYYFTSPFSVSLSLPHPGCPI